MKTQGINLHYKNCKQQNQNFVANYFFMNMRMWMIGRTLSE